MGAGHICECPNCSDLDSGVSHTIGVVMHCLQGLEFGQHNTDVGVTPATVSSGTGAITVADGEGLAVVEHVEGARIAIECLWNRHCRGASWCCRCTSVVSHATLCVVTACKAACSGGT